ncbi:MAG: hypothetical protein ACRDYE_10150 [Acidimicrobiales bacterium]
MGYESFARALDYWEQLADPDGAEASDEERRDRRDVYLAASFGGMWLGQITLDPIDGTIVADELGRLETELFEADWAASPSAGSRSSPTSPAPRSSAGPTPGSR